MGHAAEALGKEILDRESRVSRSMDGQSRATTPPRDKKERPRVWTPGGKSLSNAPAAVGVLYIYRERERVRERERSDDRGLRISECRWDRRTEE